MVYMLWHSRKAFPEPEIQHTNPIEERIGEDPELRPTASITLYLICGTEGPSRDSIVIVLGYPFPECKDQWHLTISHNTDQVMKKD